MSMHRRLTPKQKAADDMFLNLRELAELAGFSHHRMCEIAKAPGFPMLGGKVRFSAFNRWAERKTMLSGTSELSVPVPSLPRPSVDKSDVPLRSNGSRRSAPNAPVQLIAPVAKCK